MTSRSGVQFLSHLRVASFATAAAFARAPGIEIDLVAASTELRRARRGHGQSTGRARELSVVGSARTQLKAPRRPVITRLMRTMGFVGQMHSSGVPQSDGASADSDPDRRDIVAPPRRIPSPSMPL